MSEFLWAEIKTSQRYTGLILAVTSKVLTTSIETLAARTSNHIALYLVISS